MIKIKTKFFDFRLDYYCLFLLICAPFLLPEIVSKAVPMINILLTYLSIVCMFGLICLNIHLVRVKIIVLCNFYLFIIFLTTIFWNKSQVVAYFFQIWKVILMCLIINIVLKSSKKFSISFLLAIRDFTIFFFIINIIYSVINHKILVRECLYGNVNATIKCIMPGIICSLILDKKISKISKITITYFSGFIFLFIYSYNMVTALVALLFICAWITFQKVIKKKVKFYYFISIVVILIIENIIVISSNIQVLIKIAIFFGKSSDFSGRFFLWNNAIKNIKESIVCGYGYIEASVLKRIIGNPYGSHNYYLDVALNSGIVGVFFLLLLMIAPIYSIKKAELNSEIDDTQYILLGAWITYLIMFLTEPWAGWEIMFIPVIVAFLILQNK